MGQKGYHHGIITYQEKARIPNMRGSLQQDKGKRKKEKYHLFQIYPPANSSTVSPKNLVATVLAIDSQTPDTISQ